MNLRRFCLLGSAIVLLAASPRYFTVRDSIEMSRFERDDPKAVFSPDGKYFAFVSSHGIVAKNQIESTLWLYRTADVRQFLAGATAKSPAPRLWTRFSATPGIDYDTSYEPLITGIRWLPNSGSVYFLGQDSNAERRLYSLSLNASHATALSPAGYDVRNFAAAGNRMLYELARVRITPKPIGKPMGPRAGDITDAPVGDVLFPSSFNTEYIGGVNELWSSINGQLKRYAVSVANNVAEDTLAPSPDGRYAVIAIHASAIPQSWANFEPALEEGRIDPKDKSRESPEAFYALARYALLDLQTGSVRPLFDAPMAWGTGLGFGGALWSHDGSHVIVLDTFFPGSRSQCMAVDVDIRSFSSQCIAFVPSRKASALSKSFGSSDRQLVLKLFSYSGNGPTNTYQREGSTWRLISSVKQTAAQPNRAPLQVTFRQSLNTPPAVWVAANGSSARKQLFDPNPQLRSIALGKAQLFHWRDAGGHQWTGGLVLPPNYVAGKRYPLVLQAHGFDPNEFLTDGAYTTAFAARPLAAAGMVVLSMADDEDDLSTAKEPLNQLAGYQAAVQKLDSMGLIDRRKVGMIGFSRTCYYTESTLIDDPNLLAAASITDGVDESYLQAIFFDVSGSEGKQIYGALPYGSGLAKWTNAAPGFRLNRVRAPLLITALGAESILEEWEIYSQLRMQHKPVDFMYMYETPTYNHIQQRPLDRLVSQQTNVDWFRFWLQGYEDRDPAKAAMYRRWEALKKK